MKDYVTTAELATRLGVSSARVPQLIVDGVIKAEKFGRDNFLSEREAQRIQNSDRRPGRPVAKR